jgi:hypothetical protein
MMESITALRRATMTLRYSQRMIRRLGAAVLLRSACAPAAVTLMHLHAEVETRERSVAAQCSHTRVRYLLASDEKRGVRGERGAVLQGSYSLVRHRLAPAEAERPPGSATPACPRPRPWSAISAPAASPSHGAPPSTQRTLAAPPLTPGSARPARAHVPEVKHAGLSREACCVIYRYVPKLL